MVNCSNRTLVKMRFDADINQCHESGCDEDGKNNGHITTLKRQIPAGRPATVVYAQVLKIRQRFEGLPQHRAIRKGAVDCVDCWCLVMVAILRLRAHVAYLSY